MGENRRFLRPSGIIHPSVVSSPPYAFILESISCFVNSTPHPPFSLAIPHPPRNPTRLGGTYPTPLISHVYATPPVSAMPPIGSVEYAGKVVYPTPPDFSVLTKKERRAPLPTPLGSVIG